MLAIFGLAPLTLLADPAFGQTTRTNQFVTGSPNSTQTEANAASGVATARLMLPQTDSTLVKQPTADVPAELWTPPSAPPQAAPAGFSGQTPVGPNQNSFETFHPIADRAVPTIAAEVPSQPTEAPRIAMRPVVQERGVARPTPANEAIPAVRTARPQRLPAAEPSSQSATANSRSQSATQPSAAQRFAEVIAQQRAKERAKSPVTPPAAASGMYLATQTAKSKLDQAWTHFQQAELEYSSAAYASAETSAWQTLHLAAEAIDLHEQHTRSRSAIETGQTVNADPSQSAVQRLQTGRNALNEARDFVGPYATDDPESIARLARSHRTPVVRQGLPRRGRTASDSTHPDYRSAPKDQLGWYTEMLVESTDSVEQTIPNATEAIDRYLDLARMELSEVAAQSLLAAQAMDLLAAIRLGRGEATQLPGPSAICLRRAAVQGQSSNPDLVAKLGFHLADVGLVEEATWALQHSLTLRYDVQVLQKLNQLESLSPTASTVLKGAPIQSQAQTRRTPDVVTMTPEQFASVSRSVIPAQSSNSQGSNGSVPARNVSTTNPVEAQPASYRLMNTPPATAALGQSHPISGSNANEATEPQQPPTRNSSRFLPQLKKWW
ncbi:hypothetical protein CEE69_02900 [Rhodopirellula bahusiensis]|uniref:Transmembrane protein n=1 Tax=Rhodopirellula bahusiensis TaxID=2014065 RepID=A0A2G1WCJ3_9BACT|nr:hypothetical protein CEE69_02900 [Rhodopirellula bahusiensis]